MYVFTGSGLSVLHNNQLRILIGFERNCQHANALIGQE
jgi:hypothetical protein